MKHIKAFSGWMRLKEKLNFKAYKIPFVSEEDIWWASVGVNVGYEIDGKSQLFSRPVIILKKLAHGFYFVAPTTTKNKTGTWFVPFSQHDKKINACLHQVRSIDYRRLSSKLGEVDRADFEKIKLGFKRVYS